MKEQQTCEQQIGEKLNRITATGAEGLWGQMELLLNQRMPQQGSRTAPYLVQSVPESEPEVAAVQIQEESGDAPTSGK